MVQQGHHNFRFYSLDVLVETFEENKILFKEDRNYNSAKNNTQALPFHPESKQNILSFQTLQSQNKDLLTNCSELNQLMSMNRKNRLHAQQQLSKTYRELAARATECKPPFAVTELLHRIRQRIADLEEEHVNLHEQYIAQQSQFRETVRAQRRSLVDSINKTRALTSNIGIGLSLVSNTPAETQNFGDAYDHTSLYAINKRKTA